MISSLRQKTISIAVLAAFFSAALDNAAPFKIMPLGDSITGGVGSAECYRLYLDRLLTAGGYSFDFVGTLTGHSWTNTPADSVFDVDHEGHWGMEAHVMKANIGGYARAKRPDIALLHIGTNDILHESDTAGSIDAMLNRTLREIGGIIDTLRSVNPRIIVFVAQIIRDKTPVDTPRIKALNAMIPAMIASKTTVQSPLILVDQWTGIGIGDLVDTWHPNSYGAKKMANKWYAALTPVLNATQTEYRLAPATKRNPSAPQRIMLFSGRIINRPGCEIFSISGKRLTGDREFTIARTSLEVISGISIPNTLPATPSRISPQ